MKAKSLIIILFFTFVNAQSDEVSFVHFFGHIGQVESVRYSPSEFGNILDHPWFNSNRRTTIFSYGNLQTLNNSHVQNVINSYIINPTHNFVAVDYSLSWILDGGVQRLGDQIGVGLLNLLRRGYSSALIHLVGFGTGAHIVSVASLHVNREWHFISRVTGLSPTVTQNPNQIGPNVAQYVDVIHTNTDGHGNINARGMASYIVNGGGKQPWCGTDDACSHDAVMNLWAESVIFTSTQFPSLNCDTWENFCAGACNNNQISHMGLSSSQTSRGLYFLQTNHSPPFSRANPVPDNC